jgi:hypothetical protein
MILLDSDVLIDLLRKYPPAVGWFDALHEEEELVVSGYVIMELIQGCRNKAEQDRVQRELATLRPGIGSVRGVSFEPPCRVAGRADRANCCGFGPTATHIQPETLQLHPGSANHPALHEEQLNEWVELAHRKRRSQ